MQERTIIVPDALDERIVEFEEEMMKVSVDVCEDEAGDVRMVVENSEMEGAACGVEKTEEVEEDENYDDMADTG